MVFRQDCSLKFCTFATLEGHWDDPSSGFRKQGGYFKFINILSALNKPVSTGIVLDFL
jgi:hypothetical protein